MLLSILQGVLVAFMTWWILSSVQRRVAASRAGHTHAGSVITPDQRLVWGLTMGCGALGATALVAAIGWNGGPAAWAVGAAFLAFAFLSASYASPRTFVTWSGNGIEGPTSYGIYPFGPSRGHLGYDEITDVGVDGLGSFYAQAPDGSRIRWSSYYTGFADLNHEIERRRPDLFDHPTPG